MTIYQGLISEITAQKDRIFLWVPVAFAIGIAAYYGLLKEPFAYTGLIAMIAIFAPLWFLQRRQHDSALNFFLYLFTAGIFIASFGFFIAQTGTKFYGTPIPAKSIGPAMAIGEIEHIENLGEKGGSRVVLRHLKIEDLPPQETPRKIRVTFKKDDGLKAGDTISALIKIDPPSTAVLPHAYDFRRHLFFEGIGGVGFSFSAPTIVSPAQEKQSSVGLFFERLRTHINQTIHTNAGPVTAGLMTALITGERGAIAKEDNDAMRDSGLYHLLSISGTHVCMVAGVLFFFIRFILAAIPMLALYWPIKKIAAVIALCGAAFYVFLAGAEVPAQRALLMTGLVMIAIILDRSPLSLRLIAFSALVVLAIAPHSLIGVSFQMSFAAVAALIAFFDYIRLWWMKWNSKAGFIRKSLLYLIGIMMTSFIAGTMTGLFSLYHFQTFSLYGVISNMIAVPLTGFIIMPFAVLSLLFMPFGLAHFPLMVMEFGTQWMLAIAYWAAGLDGAVLHVLQWSPATFGFIVCGIVLFLLWRGWRGKAGAICIIITGILMTFYQTPYDVMVSSSGKLMAARNDAGEIYFSSKRGEKFIAENWLRLNGVEGAERKDFKAEGSGVSCDDDGCRAVIRNKKISFVNTRRAFFEDCAWADLIVAKIPMPKADCTSNAVMLDLYNFKDRGAHGVRLKPEGVFVEVARPAGGDRPWR